MQIISSITIRKFRSLKSITGGFEVSDLNVLVGQNDHGKSNILRALNLFFNGQTDVGQTLRFDDDYCYHADQGKGTRREIRIDLIVVPPKHRFKNAKPVRWVKKWKRDGSVIENRTYVDNEEEVSPIDNVSKWLDKLKYRYVPAIKSKDYFNALMGELHDVLTDAHSNVMNAQGAGFITEIQNATSQITSELERQIKVANAIQIPSDFRTLFSTLDFGSRVGGNTYHLKQRGDGIKVRHIPVILKYMAEQEKNISIPGYVKPDTIWGFEEPENNLELRSAFELAATFKKYSEDIQIFLTTHSPAFYSLDKTNSDGISCYFVQRDELLCTHIARCNPENPEAIHHEMGLLPLITPYLEQAYAARAEVSRLQDELDRVNAAVSCVVISEDGDLSPLKPLLSANDFDLSKTEFFSYDGKDKLVSAILLGKYIRSKRENVTVVVHRDRDYLSDEEVSSLRKKVEKEGLYFFVTKGVDVESHYLDVDHLHLLAPSLSKLELQAMIDDATRDASRDSLDRFVNHVLGTGRPENGDYAGAIEKVKTSYESDLVRFRYGKKVFGLVKAKIQHALKSNVDLARETHAIRIGELTAVSRLAYQNLGGTGS